MADLCILCSLRKAFNPVFRKCKGMVLAHAVRKPYQYLTFLQNMRQDSSGVHHFRCGLGIAQDVRSTEKAHSISQITMGFINWTFTRTGFIRNGFRAYYGYPSLCFSNRYMASQYHTISNNKLSGVNASDPSKYLDATDEDTFNILKKDMLVYENFISEDEEQSLFLEVEPYLKRMHYEESHWDDAIHGYRETERKHWKEVNRGILQRVRDLAFPPEVGQLAYTHVLDLAKTGVIKAHIDSVRFCGSTIAGLCLLSPCVMRLVHDKEKSKSGDVLLSQRSLYIMRDRARYEYTHEVLGEADSYFQGKVVSRDRRISVICRNEPLENEQT